MNSDVLTHPSPLSTYAELPVEKAAIVTSAQNRYAAAIHSHDCEMLFVPLTGRFSLGGADGGELAFSPGHFVWLSAFTAHTTVAQSLAQSHLAIYVDSDFWGSALRAIGPAKPAPGVKLASRTLQSLSEDAFRAIVTQRKNAALWCGAIVLEAARLSNGPSVEVQRAPVQWLAETLADEIVSDLAKSLSLNLFSERQRISRRHLERVFRSTFGMSPLAFQQAARLRHARFLIENTENSILSIAQQVGWESGSYLTRVLHQSYGLSAGEIRQSATRRRK